jgi:hypothetical protein
LFLELDTKSDSCQRFIRDSLVNSFSKVLCDEAVQTWKHEIFVCRKKKAKGNVVKRVFLFFRNIFITIVWFLLNYVYLK